MVFMFTNQMSTIESTVTRLLVATKQLLESLTQWARGEASEQDVSDVYVTLGNEFNVACRAFLNVGVEVTDLGDVPQALRVILEKALSEDASQENLDRYLPSIREIIVNLLRQLKQKQGMIRAQHGNRMVPRGSVVPGNGGKISSRSESLPGGASRQTQSYSKQPPLPQLPPQQAQQPVPSPSGAPSGAVPPSPPHQRRQSEAESELGSQSNRSGSSVNAIPESAAPPISPRKDNALLALQKGEALERRASRRFSAYQFAKLTNGSPSSKESLVPDLPPLPGGVRSSLLPTKASHESSPPEIVSSTTVVDDSSFKSTPSPGATSSPQSSAKREPDSVGEIPIYLQIGRKVKRVTVKREDLTLPALRLLFIDKFAYNPGAENFPDIYIQDPQSGIRYELDDSTFADVHSGSLLSLNGEAVDEIKKHISDSMEKLTLYVVQLNDKMEQNSVSIQHLREEQQQQQQQLAAAATAAASAPSPVRSASVRNDGPVSTASLKHIDDLRKDIAVVRQVSSHSLDGLKSQVAALLKKAKMLHTNPHLLTPGGTTRAFMEACHKKLSVDSDRLLTSVDDLQDVIEALRKDVAQRGVRHSAKQLDSVSKELVVAQKELEQMEAYIISEKPGWKKIWERELDTICEEQQFFKLQEELVSDLKDDLKKAQETFSLVEMCSNEQVKSNGSIRKVNPIISAPVEGIVHVKDAVLSEVQALQPNHDRRVEAIERAEKLRKKELERRGQGEFADELEEFVVESKLKKSGGVEETERRRMLREQKVKEDSLKSEAEAKELRRLERQRKREEARRLEEEQSEEEDESEEEEDEDDEEEEGLDAERSNDEIFESPDEETSAH